jgi:hypothetical protein
MEELNTKGKPRGRHGGRKKGAKDKGPRSPKRGDRELTEVLSFRIRASLMQRIQTQASLQGETIPDFVRNILDEHI